MHEGSLTLPKPPGARSGSLQRQAPGGQFGSPGSPSRSPTCFRAATFVFIRPVPQNPLFIFSRPQNSNLQFFSWRRYQKTKRAQSGFEPEACHSSNLHDLRPKAPEATIIPLDH
jgi:hypothetical protein